MALHQLHQHQVYLLLNQHQVEHLNQHQEQHLNLHQLHLLI
jgi:hypothetical protein